MADQVGLFIWINDVPISGSVLKLSNIVFPRSDYSSYAIGQNVTVKCPGFGKHDAVIAKIGDASEKKEFEMLLKETNIFTRLLDELSIPQAKQQHKIDGGDRSNESVEHADPDSNVAQTKTKVIKPKAVKRKIIVNDDDQLNSTKQKKLEQVAEDLALCDLSPPRLEDTGCLFSTSMAVLADTPVKKNTSMPTSSPRPSPPVTPRRFSPRHQYQCCNHQQELFSLRASVTSLEYWCKQMWDDLASVKTELANLKQANICSTPRHTGTQDSSKPVGSPNSTINVLQTTPMSSASASASAASSIGTYRGYTKSQVVAEIALCKNYKKATAKVFRMLFNKEEVQGRSLSGQRGNSGDARPQIEDRQKLSFLQECIMEGFPACSKDSINIVLRHLLKPSRNNLNDN
ncbi:hypothetical protein DPMN_171396 [Dreissena polymorpha]|uniref:BEN domain-containing protein n=2 Tax=Dreissena polymorpha TaxID=45954 RepID=A0A9D4E120_DREPO|nr:hypothetical protein DPMN_171396 [Dreissena polymorpha]